MSTLRQKFAVSRQMLVAFATFSAAVGITLWLWRDATIDARRYAESRFEFRIRVTELAIQQRMLAYEQVLRGAAGLFAASESVERHEWRAYVSALRLGQNYPGIQGVGFAQVIRPEDMEAHVRAVRAEGVPDYIVRPLGGRDRYIAVVFLEPFDWRNQRAIGYDMATEPVRRAAMERAGDTGETALSGRVRLVQETEKNVQPGLLMYLPLYRKRMPLDTVEQRREALIGYVYGPFRAGDLMRGILGHGPADIELEIFDGDTISEASLLYRDEAPGPRPAPRFHRTASLVINGRPWTLRFASLPAFEAAVGTHGPQLTLVAGLAISGLVSVVAWSLSTTRRLNVELEARVLERTDALKREVVERRRAEDEIRQLNDELEARVAERTRQLESLHRQLLETSRQAGMAEVATGVLHNVGNVLNSVNVSTTLVADVLRRSKVAAVGRVASLLREHAHELPAFLAADPHGREVTGFLETLAGHLAQEQAELLAELEALRANVDHIKEIVAMQQGYAKVSGVAEPVPVVDLVEDALRLTASALARKKIAVVREFADRPTLTVDKHKVLQVLVNLIRNAKKACVEGGRDDRRITVRVTSTGRRVAIAVSDNGVGIPPENLTRIFSHGFTTRRDGHGFGLHSGALAARELGGSLTALSDGPGRGAVFVLELPDAPPAADPSLS